MSNLLSLLVKCGKKQHCKFLVKERKSEEQKEGRGEQGREKERWEEEKGDFLELFLVSYFSFRQCGIGHWCYILYPSNSESFLNLKLLRKQNLKVHVLPEERIDYLELFAYYFFWYILYSLRFKVWFPFSIWLIFVIRQWWYLELSTLMCLWRPACLFKQVAVDNPQAAIARRALKLKGQLQ